MANGDKRTRKQHYIPQVYLRGFSPEYKQKDSRGKDILKYTIHCFDLEKMKQYPKAVPIDSICFEKDLYFQRVWYLSSNLSRGEIFHRRGNKGVVSGQRNCTYIGDFWVAYFSYWKHIVSSPSNNHRLL